VKKKSRNRKELAEKENKILMKQIITILLCFCCGLVLAQNTKGVTPVKKKKTAEAGNTYAVVVGVSDYQNEGITDLQFAHRDAEAYADYLRYTIGEDLEEEHIRMLLNEKATLAQLVAALDWLIEQVEEGDKAVIYFSGHGDVETKTRSQLGFLLLWDSPARSYMAGAYPLFYLQAVVQTLSLDKLAKVVLITDACRSGNLAGNDIGGAQLTSANLVQIFANEVKILSCQPVEYSLEGEQWGGGRGLFSYHLVNGLYGKADNNNDAEVSLLELGRYLEDNVSREADPHEQMPMTVGNKKEKMSNVFPEKLEEIIEEERNQTEPTFRLATKGDLEENVLASVDSIAKETYVLFQTALENKQFFEPADACAEDYFASLSTNADFNKLMPTIKGNYAAALQDDVQQALNALLAADPNEVNKLFHNTEAYKQYPRFLERSIELLGEDHYTYKSLRAKQYLFEGILTHFIKLSEDGLTLAQRWPIYWKGHELLDQAIDLQPESSYLYYVKSLFYSHQNPSSIDSILILNQKALELSPKWLLPRIAIASEYIYNLDDFENMKIWLEEALEVDPESYVVLERLNWQYMMNGHVEDGMRVSKKLLELRPDLFNSYGNLGGVYFQMRAYEQSEDWYKQSLAISGEATNFANLFLGQVYFASRRADEAITHYDRLLADEKTPFWLIATFNHWCGKGIVNTTKNYKKAEPYFDYVINKGKVDPSKIDKDKAETYVMWAKAKYMQGQNEDAIKLLNEALRNDSLGGHLILNHAIRADIENQAGNKAEAEKWFQKSIAHTTGVYIYDMDYREEALFRYGRFLIGQNRLEEAQKLFEEVNVYTHDRSYFGYMGMALLAAQNGDEKTSLDNIEKALERWLPYPELLEREPLLKKTLKSGRYKKLMKTYFK